MAQRAVPRDGGSRDNAGETRTPRTGGTRVAPRPAPSGDSSPRTASPAGRPAAQAPPSQGSDSGSASEDRDDRSDRDGSQAAPRARGNRPDIGTAVARRSGPGAGPGGGGGHVIVVPGGAYHPWGYGGLGFAGYYDPWYSGYAGHYYRPARDDGNVRLKVKPREAAVYVDGYYTGLVDEFDGIFQRMPLEPGPHRIEIRLEEHHTLAFDVRVLPERTLTLTGVLEPIQAP
jgi:hypothetical protein